jgi:hypothetical protein
MRIEIDRPIVISHSPHRDTIGVEPEVYRDALAKIDRNTIKGKPVNQRK